MPDEMARRLILERGDGGARHFEDAVPDPSSPVIGILGTGDFSRSLARRLVASGYQVVVGSRTPTRFVALFPEEAEVTTQLEAANKADLIFVAVYPEHHSTLMDLKQTLAGKTLVDVSNSLSINHKRPSNAELLADYFPGSFVVKGFNTVSAWTLQMGARDGGRQVFLCSNSQTAKNLVKSICHRMGFIPVDMGLLSSSLEIENLPLYLFPSWRLPVLCMLILFIFFYLYNFIRDVLYPFITEHKSAFYKMPIEVVNVTLPSVALVMLALVYLPGLLAAFLQLWSGTKYNRFPNWLDRWLLSRKQLGLCSFLCAVLHAVYSLCLPLRKSAQFKLSNMAYKQMCLVSRTLGWMRKCGGWSCTFPWASWPSGCSPCWRSPLFLQLPAPSTGGSSASSSLHLVTAPCSWPPPTRSSTGGIGPLFLHGTTSTCPPHSSWSWFCPSWSCWAAQRSACPA
ncbi:metalloreductase STEAP3 isoform X3 [Poecilia latipinna]|uniref:metalloreductase STEAP3 isoform X3 n=1 Tax=Poecilia latipinna TaxID=48699 RepID=UPI00072EE5D6|nr:PREDICTED: metalloreductase STEAP3 isoform X3 [Poecilia latipinna]